MTYFVSMYLLVSCFRHTESAKVVKPGRQASRSPFAGADEHETTREKSMRVVAVMNYKGGVGKTTVTANLGALAASRGLRVLLIDLDPQTNLTFSFYEIDEWHHRLKDENRTIRQWYEDESPGRDTSLADLVVTPERVNRVLEHSGGRIDLISSHLGLIDIDLQLAARLGGATTLDGSKQRFLELHSCLREALRDDHFAKYDLVLIDCAPNFGIVTKTAIVASEQVLVPAKADYLSTLGLDYLVGNCRELVEQFNDFVNHKGGSKEYRPIDPGVLGVVFTMVQIYSQQVVAGQQAYIDQVGLNSQVPVLKTTIRNSPRDFGDAGQGGVPAMLRPAVRDDVVREFDELTDEVLSALELPAGGHR
ncbi:ParA family protein [Amycolatopsis camponoti]|nr:AAA family ATPase [Amycolatopsis camponoti]